MAAATIVDSFVAVEGPKKKEVANLSSVDNGDTYTSTIQRPEFGYFVPNKAAGALTAQVAVSISGRVVTLASADLSDSTGVLVLYGF
jgi:hypothetical protein